uniref:Uncharacterized protein n=1 Tax=Taeniopygia guttata TaxID=59729 RepID=A0A674H8K5_TAEGU
MAFNYSEPGQGPVERPRNKSGLCQHLSSENHLSKPDVREIAKAYPRIPAGGHKSSGISQTAEVDPLDSFPAPCEAIFKFINVFRAAA